MEIESNAFLPDKLECQNFSKSQSIEYICAVIDKLECSVDLFDSNSLYNLILRLSTSYFDYYHKYIDAVCDVLIKRNVVKLMHTFLVQLTNPINYQDRTVILILTLLANFSDHSDLFAQQIQQCGLLNLIVDLNLKTNVFNVQQDEINRFIYMCVVIINNYTRKLDNAIFYKVDILKRRLINYVEINSHDKLGIVSVLTLSYIIEDRDVHLLNDCTNTVDQLINLIKSTVELDKRADGFTLFELIHGLRCISANDRMKEQIEKAGGIPVLLEIIQRDAKCREIEPILGTLDHLCFNDRIKSLLINDHDIKRVLEPFENNECQIIRKLMDGILWNINSKWQSTQSLINEQLTSFDVFVSYSWSNKEQILEIIRHFKESKICFWIDEEHMKGSCFEAMARGIENSNLVVIAMSSSYYRSANCRREAEYAARLNKPIIPLRMEQKYKPVSWLGIIVSCELCYEFSGYRNKELEMMRLLKYIRSNLHSSGDKNLPYQEKSNNDGSIDDLNLWNREDVATWLQAYDLSHLTHAFARIDGSLLSVMFDMRSRSADYFNNCLKHEFGMSFVDVLVFHKALNELLVAL